MDKPLWKDANFATFLNGCFYGQKRLGFYIARHQTLFLGERNLKRNIDEISNFHQNTRLTTCQKCKICDFFKSMFLWSNKGSFLYRTSPNTFSRRHVSKKKQ